MLCILFLMIVLHVIEDFVLQPICLSKLKQKEWWHDNACKDIDGKYDNNKWNLYKNDYKIALALHSISWSIMIMLPFIFIVLLDFFKAPSILPDAWVVERDIALLTLIIINSIWHYIIDDVKANHHRINLIEDQILHLIQIGFAYCICCIIFF